MVDGLRNRGVSARLVDSHRLAPPDMVAGLLGRLDRVAGDLSPSRALLNSVTFRAITRGTEPFAVITNGTQLTARTVRLIRQCTEARGGGVACFLCDDPFNPVHSTPSWLDSLREYSLVVSTKRDVIPDLVRNGCRAVEYCRFGFDPMLHRRPDSHDPRFEPCDSVFAGIADRDRLPLMRRFIGALPELDHRLYGDGWLREPALRRVSRPKVTGPAYRAAVSASTVCLCLVRRANRDGHVMRSFELPAIGAFMLAERTREHLEIFEEGVHCDFWSDVDELIEKTRWYCSNPRKAGEIALRGHEFILEGGNTYGHRALQVLQMLGADVRGEFV